MSNHHYKTYIRNLVQYDKLSKQNISMSIQALIFQYKSQAKIGQNCRNFGWLSKILSDEILSDKVLIFVWTTCHTVPSFIMMARTKRMCLYPLLFHDEKLQNFNRPCYKHMCLYVG